MKTPQIEAMPGMSPLGIAPKASSTVPEDRAPGDSKWLSAVKRQQAKLRADLAERIYNISEPMESEVA